MSFLKLVKGLVDIQKELTDYELMFVIKNFNNDHLTIRIELESPGGDKLFLAYAITLKMLETSNSCFIERYLKQIRNDLTCIDAAKDLNSICERRPVR